jgi:CubicO group peptidase (beta-lactamase class C family)
MKVALALLGIVTMVIGGCVPMGGPKPDESMQAVSIAGGNYMERELDRAFQAQELSGLHSVLIIHHGKILAEKYYPGADESWGESLGTLQSNANSLHDLRSVTKSITGILYGIALVEGHVPGPDESLIAHFPEYEDLASDAQRRKILVRHALTMQMGIEWNEDLPYTDPRNSEIAMELAVDRYRYVLGQPIIS